MFKNQGNYMIFCILDIGFADYFRPSLDIISCHFSAGTHLVPKTSSRQRFQDIQNVNSEDVHKT